MFDYGKVGLVGHWQSPFVFCRIQKKFKSGLPDQGSGAVSLTAFAPPFGCTPAAWETEFTEGKLHHHMLDALKGNESRVSGFAGQYWNLLNSLRKRLHVVASFYRQAQTNGEKVLAEVQLAQLRVDQMQQEYVQEYYKVQELWNH